MRSNFVFLMMLLLVSVAVADESEESLSEDGGPCHRQKGVDDHQGTSLVSNSKEETSK